MIVSDDNVTNFQTTYSKLCIFFLDKGQNKQVEKRGETLNLSLSINPDQERAVMCNKNKHKLPRDLVIGTERLIFIMSSSIGALLKGLIADW